MVLPTQTFRHVEGWECASDDDVFTKPSTTVYWLRAIDRVRLLSEPVRRED